MLKCTAVFFLSLIVTCVHSTGYDNKERLKSAIEYVTANTEQGILQGTKKTTVSGTPYYSFQGIPYAQPPVGKLRFKAPQSPQPWDSVRNAVTEGSMCPQYLLDVFLTGNEDCLYLNVYTPELPSEDSDGLNTTVMVYIHGGGFYMLSGNQEYFGHEYLMDENIVLVTLNYRLGALGFLGLNHSSVSKNNGLKDQVAALKWVQENIKYFGGNPDDVTIFGQSAGGASVHYHLLSPKTQGLFHRAIAQSGSALNDWAFAEPSYAHDRATILAQYLGYGLNGADDIFEVLQSADVKDIIHYQDISVTDHDIIHDVNIPFVPTFEDSGEDAFITQAPLDIIKNGEFKQIPYITGVTSEEGKYFTSDVLLDPTLWPQLQAHFESLAVPEVLGLSMKSNESLAILDQVKQLYFGNESVSANTLEQYVHLKSDREIVTGVHRALKLQLQIGSAPTYFYVFSYFGELSLSERNHYNYTFPGAAHADDMEYLMTPSVLTVTADKHPEEVKVIHYLTQMWTNFAKYGDPTRNMDVTWYPITDEHFTYINIDSELSIEDLNGFETERMEFWDEIYGNIDSLS